MITGTREPDDRIRKFVKFALGLTTYFNPSESDPLITMFQGEARGVDDFGKSLWHSWGYPTRDFPANWKLYKNQAGGIRNQEMVDAKPAFCLAFPGPDSVGTWDAVRRAKLANIKTFVLIDKDSMHDYYNYVTSRLEDDHIV